MCILFYFWKKTKILLILLVTPTRLMPHIPQSTAGKDFQRNQKLYLDVAQGCKHRTSLNAEITLRTGGFSLNKAFDWPTQSLNLNKGGLSQVNVLHLSATSAVAFPFLFLTKTPTQATVVLFRFSQFVFVTHTG